MTFDELVAAQHGVFTRRQAVAAGVSARKIEVRVARGQWRRVHPRVYAAHAGPLPPRARLVAALLHAGRPVAVSHASAAFVHGLGDEPPDVHVTVPAARRLRGAAGVVVHRSRVLDARDVVRRGPIAVTTVERTLCDLARDDVTAVRGAVADAVQRRLTAPALLRAAGRRLGLDRRRAWCALLGDVEGGSHSALELEFLDLCRRYGLPVPERQVRLGGRYVDAAFRGGLVVAEIDSRAHHLSAADWERDLARQNEIVTPGRVVLRFTARMIREQPGRVAARLRAALAAIDAA